MKEFASIMREEARLIILRALAGEVNESATSSALAEQLVTFSIDKPRAWVHDQLSFLADMGAVTLTPAGSVQIATLTDKGARHLRRQIAIEGVKRPSRPEA